MSEAAEAALGQLEAALGYRFTDRSLLERSLMHGSLPASSDGKDNETLEFLGDAVIDLAVSEALMREHPDFDEGRLSRTRAALVAAPSLARVATKLDLGRWLRLGRGEEISGGRGKARILAGCYEAVVGAVFLDSEYAIARELVLKHLGPLVESADIGADYKTRLQEVTQARDKMTPTYRTVDVSGPDHARHYRAAVEIAGQVLGTGEGSSRRRAEQNAARAALRQLGAD